MQKITLFHRGGQMAPFMHFFMHKGAGAILFSHKMAPLYIKVTLIFLDFYSPDVAVILGLNKELFSFYDDFCCRDPLFYLIKIAT